jgi:ABC-type multidrug transport system ATPase subunit
MKTRTTIVIAHRLSTIRSAHCIYVMDEGHIVEQGTHDELLKLNRFYFALVHKQMSADELKGNVGNEQNRSRKLTTTQESRDEMRKQNEKNSPLTLN